MGRACMRMRVHVRVCLCLYVFYSNNKQHTLTVNTMARICTLNGKALYNTPHMSGSVSVSVLVFVHFFKSTVLLSYFLILKSRFFCHIF